MYAGDNDMSPCWYDRLGRTCQCLLPSERRAEAKIMTVHCECNHHCSTHISFEKPLGRASRRHPCPFLSPRIFHFSCLSMVIQILELCLSLFMSIWQGLWRGVDWFYDDSDVAMSPKNKNSRRFVIIRWSGILQSQGREKISRWSRHLLWKNWSLSFLSLSFQQLWACFALLVVRFTPGINLW